MRFFTAVVALIAIIPLSILAQTTIEPTGGGSLNSPSYCLSDEAAEDVKARLIANMAYLTERNLLPPPNAKSITLLDWPLRQAAGFNDPDYYVITNFVDQTLGSNNGISDYNCGARTYDGHRGIDMLNWPFRWYKQEVGQVEVVAAAPGVIIGKDDGFFDKNCDFSNFNWNAVYIRHADGSVAWYGHLKKNSLTDKPVGASVAKGEYLGVVGSSGYSTDPHLHFEIYADAQQTVLVDPYAGPCNNLNGNTSWWADQRPYQDPVVNKIMTHNAPPEQNFGCPSDRDVRVAANAFQPGDQMFFSTHFRDRQQGDVMILRIFRPDNSLYATLDHVSPDTYSGAWWYWWYYAPSGSDGLWRYEVEYLGQTYQHFFTVEAPLPVDFVQLKGHFIGKNVQLDWTTAAEINSDLYIIERSLDGKNFTAIGKIESHQNEGGTSTYTFLDDNPILGTLYYRVQHLDLDGTPTLSNTIAIHAALPTQPTFLYPNPVENELRIHFSHDQTIEPYQLQVFNALGQLVLEEQQLTLPTLTLPVADLPSGAYFLILKTTTQQDIRLPFMKN